MARQLETRDGRIRVLFRPEEAAAFLRGWEPVPGHGGDDPLNRALQNCFDALNDGFPDAGGAVEPFVEPAPWAEDPERAWYVVNFRFPREEVEKAGHDPDALADWVAEHTPDLLFSFEDGAGRPLRFEEARRRAR